MAGRYFYTAINAQMEGGEVNLFCARKSNIKHITAARHQAFRESQLQRLTCQTNVAADNNLFWFQTLRISATNTPGNILIKLFT